MDLFLKTSLFYTQMALNLKQVWAIWVVLLFFYIFSLQIIMNYSSFFMWFSLSLSLSLFLFMYYILWYLCITYFIFYILYCISKQNSALVSDCKLLAGMFSCARRAVNDRGSQERDGKSKEWKTVLRGMVIFRSQ